MNEKTKNNSASPPIDPTRRGFIKIGIVNGVAVWLAGPQLLKSFGAAREGGVCLTICNHWSYTGIGWQLGIESCVLSVTDAMEMADREPHAKTCLNLDARAYEFMAEKFPEVTDRLKKYLAAGKVELIGGTYGQPMGTSIGGESNIRQIVVGREAIRKSLGYEMVTFLEEEEFTHPQIPQIAKLAGFKYASLAQLDTWGRAGCPVTEFNVIAWKGIDGSTILSVPKNSLFGLPPDMKTLTESPVFKSLAARGKPLLFTWEEFGWESHEHPAYESAPEKYQSLAKQYPVEFVTMREYLDKYGAKADETVMFPLDAWNKSLTWGLGGDQVRIFDRKVEGILLAAELFDTAVGSVGSVSRQKEIEGAWKELLVSQSHDVGLCESSRWQGDRMAPLERIEDLHNFTWGAIGYNHLDAAQQQGNAMLQTELDVLADRINSTKGKKGALAVTLFNPLGWSRGDLATTGRFHPNRLLGSGKTHAPMIKDRAGSALPAQIVASSKDEIGAFTALEMAFLPGTVPSAGYETYYLDFPEAETAPPATTLKIDAAAFTLENEHIRVVIDPNSGAVASLILKKTGAEFLDGKTGAFPHFTGRPNPNLSLTPNPPAGYDSAASKAQIDWTESGPVRATVRAQHHWQYLTFETRVSLTAGSPFVEICTRVLARVPPHSDGSPPDIYNGYWASLALAFEPAQVIRDYPLAVEETKKDWFHALTFVDLQAKDRGLLYLHPGTQFFRKHPGNIFANLLMREWESHFTREYGWPVYVEYRHALYPHDGVMSNAERLRAAAAFARPTHAVVKSPSQGAWPASKSFINITPDNVQLSAFRNVSFRKCELRMIENQGKQTDAVVELGLPFKYAVETDFLGNIIKVLEIKEGRLAIGVEPWKIRNILLSM
ncbi:MAG: hypothetical protein HY286_12370 [Planctomycetes bacterium]|nr:hypothetical protein [Planctomycetota bacterium]